jgi:Tfp pilus assembly protein PilV
LIECMVAVAVLTIAMLGLAQLTAVSVYQSAFARSNTMAVSVAQQKLESLRLNYTKDLLAKVTTPGSGPSSDLTAGTHSPVPVTLPAPTGSAMSNVTFNVGWIVTISGSQTLVRVTVAPQNANPQQNETVFATALFAP